MTSVGHEASQIHEENYCQGRGSGGCQRGEKCWGGDAFPHCCCGVRVRYNLGQKSRILQCFKVC
eukprot:2621087-Rhodomonas_salina.2